jgi:predicted amidohydrolase
MSRLRVALVQLAADQDVSANLERATALVERAGETHPGLIALPELFLFRGPASGFRDSATDLPGR